MRTKKPATFILPKQQQREETDRLIREAMAGRGVTITQADTRIDAKCGKCGEINKVAAPKGATRVEFKCKSCGAEQRTM